METIKDMGNVYNMLRGKKQDIKTVCIVDSQFWKNNNTSKCPWVCKEMHKKFNNVYLWVVGLQAAFIFFLKLACIFKCSKINLYSSSIQKAVLCFCSLHGLNPHSTCCRNDLQQTACYPTSAWAHSSFSSRLSPQQAREQAASPSSSRLLLPCSPPGSAGSVSLFSWFALTSPQPDRLARTYNSQIRCPTSLGQETNTHTYRVHEGGSSSAKWCPREQSGLV